MHATDSNGASEAEIVMTQNTVYLKEITAPAGYRYNATAYRVALEANQTASTTVPDVEQLGNLTIYKEGEVLTGRIPMRTAQHSVMKAVDRRALYLMSMRQRILPRRMAR